MQSILDKQKTLMISSLDGEKNPRISYAPYVFMDNKFYIYISKVAEHHNNILNNPNISIMVIEDENNVDVTFARTRVSFEGNAKMIEETEEIMNQFSEVQGKTIIKLLRGLDFNLFEINVTKGRLVKGFGQAFDVELKNGEWETTQVVIEKQHQ